MKTQTPFGVKDYLPQEISKRESVLKTIKKSFQTWSYQRLSTPTFEYDKVLSPALGPGLADRSIRFFDPSGQLIVLRPDHTAPIARIVASQMREDSLPLRISYIDPVFRRDPHGGEMETFQAGVELIGIDGPEADAEVIMLAAELLSKLGFKNFGIDIGHAALTQMLPAQKREALLKRDYVAFGKIPERGGVEIVKKFPELMALHKRLSKQGLAKHLTFNRGLVRELDYYTGVVFECHIPGCGKIVGSGGRYNRLLAQFGYDQPAVGFALSINDLMGLR